MNHYQGKVAVVTGAASGIGRALAVQLAGHGARLALADVNMAALEETRALCGPSEARCYQVDVSQRQAVFGLADQVKHDFGTAHFIFNNAGVALVATVAQSTIEEIEWQLAINLWGVIYGTKAFLPIFQAQDEGHIVNISSVFGLIGFPGQGAYNISKFGVRGLTECLWSELEGTGVKATTVHPGGIRTQIGAQARFGQNATERERSFSTQFEKALITPPEDCARAILAGVAKGKNKIVTGNQALLTDWLSRLLPTSYHHAIRRKLNL